LTPKLRSLEPTHGNVNGGDLVTFYGEKFSDYTGDYDIKIDGVPCEPTFATIESVTCKTGKREKVVEPSITIYINEKGRV
jgi:hypothetical protein